MFAAYVRDVTSRKAAEQSVRRLAAIVEHSNDAIVATDLRGTIVAWNPAAEELYGWKAEEIIGRHISATAPADRHSEANFLARQVAEGRAVSGHRTVRMRKDGSLVDVSLTISPIIGDHDKPVGMAGIVRDITEEKRIEGERIRLLDQEKAARLRAEELEQRASFIAEAQAALDSSLKFDEVLKRLMRLIVPMLADWCAIHTWRRTARSGRWLWGMPTRRRNASPGSSPGATPAARRSSRSARPSCAPESRSTSRDHRRADRGDRP